MIQENRSKLTLIATLDCVATCIAELIYKFRSLKKERGSGLFVIGTAFTERIN